MLVFLEHLQERNENKIYRLCLWNLKTKQTSPSQIPINEITKRVQVSYNSVEKVFVFISQQIEYPYNNTHDIFFLDISRIF